jgi:hypothetical protein
VQTTQRRVTVLFYVLLVAVLGSVLLQLLPLVLPDGLASRIGHNSEGLALALVVALWIQFARPGLERHRWEWHLTMVAMAVCVAAGLLLLLSDLPSRFRTLNETFLAAALLIPYLQVRRPLPRGLAVGLSAGILVVVVAWNRTGTVTDLAETLGVLLLAPLAFDLVDRAILDPTAGPADRLRAGWYLFLVAAPLAFSLLEYRLGVDGVLGEAVRYAVRCTEAFVFLLAVQIYFAIALGRSGRPPMADAPTLSPAVG